MRFVRGLEQEDAAGLEDAGDVAEDGERVRQVFEDVVGENQIEGGVGIGDAAGVGDFAFVQHGVIDDTGIEIDAADLCGQSPKVHLLDDTRARAKVENDDCGGEALEDALAEELVVPVAGVAGIEGAVEFFDEGTGFVQSSHSSPAITSLFSYPDPIVA